MQTQLRPDRLLLVLDIAMRVLAVVHAVAGAFFATWLTFLFMTVFASSDDDHELVTWIWLICGIYVVLCCLATFSRYPVRRGWCGVAASLVAIVVLLLSVSGSGLVALVWLAPPTALLFCAAPAVAAPYRN